MPKVQDFLIKNGAEVVLGIPDSLEKTEEEKWQRHGLSERDIESLRLMRLQIDFINQRNVSVKQLILEYMNRGEIPPEPPSEEEFITRAIEIFKKLSKTKSLTEKVPMVCFKLRLYSLVLSASQKLGL